MCQQGKSMAESQRKRLGFAGQRNRRLEPRISRINTDEERPCRHVGIVTCTQDPDPLALAQNIHDAVKNLESCEGKLLKVIRKN
jgi:hypothetical protein